MWSSLNVNSSFGQSDAFGAQDQSWIMQISYSIDLVEYGTITNDRHEKMLVVRIVARHTADDTVLKVTSRRVMINRDPHIPVP